jgi:hypothetical protein
VFINDNVGTQIDGLGHVTTGDDNHWYNGFKEADWGGNFGVRKCDATTIPPVITRGVLIDVAGMRKVDALPSHYRIPVDDLKASLGRQKTRLRPGDTVLIRTSVLRYWGKDGGDHDKLRQHDADDLLERGAGNQVVAGGDVGRLGAPDVRQPLELRPVPDSTRCRPLLRPG